MIRAFALFGCVIGLFVMVLLLAGGPQSGDVAARETISSHETLLSKEGCVTREVALDEGYGVSRKVSQLVCPDMN